MHLTLYQVPKGFSSRDSTALPEGEGSFPTSASQWPTWQFKDYVSELEKGPKKAAWG